VARSIAINHSDSQIVVGMMDGSIWLIKCDNSGKEFTWSLDKYIPGPKKKGIAFEISDIKFSPDDSRCAIGAHDGLVRIY
jgi:WD40 repeat protein